MVSLYCNKSSLYLDLSSYVLQRLSDYKQNKSVIDCISHKPHTTYGVGQILTTYIVYIAGCYRIWQGIKEHQRTIACWLVTYLVVLPILLRNNHHSPYHKLLSQTRNMSVKIHEYKQTNEDLYQTTHKYLSSLDDNTISGLIGWNEKATIKVLVTLVTTSRSRIKREKKEKHEPHYLTQVVAQYVRLKLLNVQPDRIDIKLLLCDVDPLDHNEADEMSKFASIVHAHVKGQPNIESFEQEKRDYVTCLNHSSSREADYMLISEDDALPHDDLLKNLDHIFTYRTPKFNNSFGFIKLFHPTRLNGYISPDINRLMEWFALAGLLEYITLAARYICGMRQEHGVFQRLLTFLFFLVLLLAVGRINISVIRSLSPHLHRLVPTPSCCVPALVYSHAGLNAMVNYLSSVECYKGFAKDTAMDEFGAKTGYKNWFYEPNLYTHIGVYTTRRQKLVDPDKVD